MTQETVLPMDIETMVAQACEHLSTTGLIPVDLQTQLMTHGIDVSQLEDRCGPWDATW